MKKRILSACLCVCMLLSMLVVPAYAASVTSCVSSSEAYKKVTELAAGRPNVRNVIETATPKVANGTASIEFTLRPKQNDETPTKGSTVAAVLMSADDYINASKYNNAPTKLNNTNYHSLTDVGTTFYRFANKTLTGDALGDTISFAADLRKKPMNVDSATAADYYYDDYVFILFNVEAGAGGGDQYVVGKFQVDSQGNLKTDSYMVRYLKNANAVGTSVAVSGTVAQQIAKPSSAESGLVSTAYTRNGYSFIGWDEDSAAVDTLAKVSGKLDINKAAMLTEQELKLVIDYWYTENTKKVPAQTADTIVNLYAQWQPIKVDFEEETKQLTDAQVGKAFDSGVIALKDTSSPNTAKLYTVISETKLPAGLNIQAVGNTGWQITGTPTAHSDGKPVSVTIQVQDNVNKTTDTVIVIFDQIKKGEQPSPDLDVNTGLGTAMDGEDGRLIGFYAAGQPEKTDSANEVMTDGTGTYTSYYLTKGMVYEYRPKTEAELPWRAIPAPDSYYNLTDETAKATFMEALKAGSAGNVVTTKVAAGASEYTIETVTAWDAAYGAIQFMVGLPVVTGLAKDAEYEIRFRGNDTFDASTPTQITVGGAAASGVESSYSVLFNLMGGKVFKVTTTPPDTEGGESIVTEVDVTDQLFGKPLTGLKAGDTVNLPTLTLTANERLEFRKEGSTFAGLYDGTITYTPEGTWSFTMPAYSVGLAALWGEISDPSAFAPIVFYDWDGTTMLGSVIVAIEATQNQIEESVKAFEQTLTAPPESDVAQYPLSAKENYFFGKWIPINSTAPTNYGKAVAVDNISNIVEIPEPEGADFSKLSHKGMTVKAAYWGDSTALDLLTSTQSRNYNINLLYGDMINATTYSLTFEVRRSGVHRVRDLALKVTQTTKTGNAQAIILNDLADQDTVTAEVVLTTAMSDIRLTVVDNNLGTWSTVPVRGQSDSVLQAGDNGFVSLGYVGATNARLAENKAGSVSATYFSSMGIMLTADNVAGGAGLSGARLRAQAQDNLLTGWKELNGITGAVWDAEGNYQRLTREEIITVIATGHYGL